VRAIVIGVCLAVVVAVLQPRSPHAAPNPPMATLPTGTRWIDIDEGRGVHLRAAVAWPEGRDPVPVVIVLHGTEGFNEDYVHLAEAFAGRGFIGVAGCWFAGNECPDGPRFQGVAAGSVAHVDALIAVGRGLPRARADRIGLFGHSRGASLALWAASTGRDVRAVVGSSAQLAPGYTAGRRAVAIDVSPITVLPALRAPVLFLHALGDDVAPVREVWQYEHAAYELGKPVESRYYDTGDHGLPFARATRDDVLRRASEFLKRNFQP
jgi:dienelactone hydrolase